MIDVVHLLREKIRLIEGGVSGRLNDCEDHSFVLVWRQFALREHVERNHQQQNNYPQGKDNRSVPKGAGQRPRVSITNTIKAPINPAGETAFGISLAQELRSHHRGQCQRHEARDNHRACKSERELTEQSAGQSTLNGHRCIHRSQRDGHGDYWRYQFAGRIQSRAERRLAKMKVTLNVLHHHDRVIYHQPDRKHDCQQSQQVDGEACYEHQEDRSNQRDRDGNNRNEDRTERAEEEKDNKDNNEQRLSERVEHFVDSVLNVFRRVVWDSNFHSRGKLRPDSRKDVAHVMNHFQRVGRGKHPDAHEGRGLSVEADILFVVLGAQHNVSNFTQPHHNAILLFHNELAEFFRCAQIGVCNQVN